MALGYSSVIIFYHNFHCDETFRNQSSLSSGKELWKQRILRGVIPKKKYILFFRYILKHLFRRFGRMKCMNIVYTVELADVRN